MNGLARFCAALSAALALTTSVAGCGPFCESAAKAEIQDLKQAVAGLLPDPVAATLAEENDCESGSGGFLTFTASSAMTSEQIFAKFLAKGWERINDPEKEGCLRCVAGLDGVTTEWGSDVIYLRINKSDEDGTLDILAAIQ